MLYFCQFKITFLLCCALSKWNFSPAELGLCYSNGTDPDGCSLSQAGVSRWAPKSLWGHPTWLCGCGVPFPKMPQTFLRLNSRIVPQFSNLRHFA